MLSPIYQTTPVCTPAFDSNLPTRIHIWYGTTQTFGTHGVAQRWINILGNVAAVEEVQSLAYSLNDGNERFLVLGPDRRRLLAPGDFNVELEREKLELGENCLRLILVTKAGEKEETAVKINYQPTTSTPSYHINWQNTTLLTEVAQPVDGLWEWDENGVRPAPNQIGYDRSLAIGDLEWTNYELLVPMTLNAIDSSAFGSPISVGPGFGAILHWPGHSDEPIQCGYIRCGWRPTGAWAWFALDRERLELNARPPDNTVSTTEVPLTLGKTYWLRVRTTATPLGNLYQLKAWKEGQPEPKKWQLHKQTHRLNFSQGALLLVAHHVDVTFGDIEVTPINDMPKTFMLASYLAQLPLFLLSGLVFVWSWRWGKRDRTLFLLCQATAILLAATGLIDIYFDMNLPVLLNQLRWEEDFVRYAVVGSTALQSLLYMSTFCLFGFAAYRWRHHLA
ncbi:MAG: hypothetical protein AAF614_21875 [Chloroflexota bacterium]